MNTKFIEGTNEQYSIREDGQVIIHYRYYRKYTHKIYLKSITLLKINENRRVYFTLNNKRIGRTITSLLKTHFKFFYCFKCNTKVYSIKEKQHKCSKCVRIVRKNNNKRLSHNYKERSKRAANLNLIFLSDSYINSSFRNTPSVLIFPELMELKRQQLLLHRTIKSLNNE